MRTVPCGCYSSRSTSCVWDSWRRPLTFLVVLLGLAFALSELFGRFVSTDPAGNAKSDIRILNGKINQITQHLDNLALLQLEMDKKISEMAQCCLSDQKDKNSKLTDLTKCPEDIGDTKRIIDETVQQAIATYDADDIGLADFALETAGGSVVSTPDTESYTVGIQPATLFGIPLCYPKNTPQEMIKPSSLPGECWAFKGGCGSAILRLLGYVNISSISVEHIPENISPAGNTSSAPREFSLWGINCDNENDRVLLGNFVYDNKRKPVQNFPIQFQSKQPFHHVLLKFHSNHGHPNYTCVYRVRIHGTLVQTSFGLR